MELIEKRLLLPFWERGLLLVKLRWGAFGAASIFYGVARFFCDSLDVVNLAPIGLVAVLLGVGNLVFHLSHKYLNATPRTRPYHRRAKTLFFFEVSVDYLCVSILIYFYGFSSFNGAVLYLPHVILTSIIFEKRKYSAFVAAACLALSHALTYVHRAEISAQVEQTVLGTFPIDGAVQFALFNTGLVIFISYLTGILVSVITQRNNELLGINQRLVELDREKQNYTLRATHELKAPFAAIRSYTQVILGGYLGEVSPKLKSIVQKIDARCASLLRMITHIIQLSNLRTTVYLKEDLQERPINEFVQTRLAHYFEKYPEATVHAEFETELDDDIQVPLVPNLFKILLDHLIDNAVRYSDNDATIWVILNRSEEGKLRLQVKDLGVGIPSDKIDKIFGEHFRTEEAALRYPDGNGMGLAIVREVVRLHGAEIHVNSQPGEGTTFRLEL